MTVIDMHMKKETVRQILMNKFDHQTVKVETVPKNLKSDQKLTIY